MRASKRLKGVQISSENLEVGSGSSRNQFGDEDTNETVQNQQDSNHEVVTTQLEMLDNQGNKFIKREPTRAKDVWTMPKGQKIIVHFNSLFQPIEKGGGILGGFLGTMARKGTLCPINYNDWREVPSTIKDKLLETTRKHFDIPRDFRINCWILQSISRKWKDYKHELKAKNFIEGRTQQEIVDNRPVGVKEKQWEGLVQYWFSQKSKVRAEKGKVARSNVKAPHTMGSKSFARCRDQYQKENGKSPGFIEFYALTHKRKDGSFVNETSQQFVDTATSLLMDRGCTSGSSNNASIENSILDEVMGEDRYGRVKGYGLGVTKNQLYGSESQNTSGFQREQVRLEEQLNVMIENYNTLQGNYYAMEQNYEEKLLGMQNHIVGLETKMEKVSSLLERLLVARADSSN